MTQIDLSPSPSKKIAVPNGKTFIFALSSALTKLGVLANSVAVAAVDVVMLATPGHVGHQDFL